MRGLHARRAVIVAATILAVAAALASSYFDATVGLVGDLFIAASVAGIATLCAEDEGLIRTALGLLILAGLVDCVPVAALSNVAETAASLAVCVVVVIVVRPYLPEVGEFIRTRAMRRISRRDPYEPGE
jgi:hypothetical protein